MFDTVPLILLRMINSIAIVLYCNCFLTPKIKDVPRKFIFTGFGIGYFILQYLMRYLIGQMDFLPSLADSLLTILVLIMSVFVLSNTLFKKNRNLHIFLICSFFVVLEINTHLSQITFALLRNLHMPIINRLLLADIISTPEDINVYFQIMTAISWSVFLLLYTAIFYYTLRNLVKNFTYKNHTFKLFELLYLILPCLSGFSLIFILRSIILTLSDNEMLSVIVGTTFDYFVPLAGAVILLTLIGTVKLFQSQVNFHMEEKEKLVLQKQTQQIQEQMRDIDSVYSEIKGMRHDMKSHISNIRLLVQSAIKNDEGVYSELENYLGKFEDTFSKFEIVYKTGNSITDIIIHQKYLESVEKKIAFSSDFVYPTRLNLDIYDLAVILNNGLENAIEACNGIEQEPYIKLNAYLKGEMFFIEIENKFIGHVAFDDVGLPISNKSDSGNHGIGLSNIQRCARKYFGEIDFEIANGSGDSNKTFRLIVMLQGRI